MVYVNAFFKNSPRLSTIELISVYLETKGPFNKASFASK